MQITSRFTIATHILLLLAMEGEASKLTSEVIAGSVGSNPVIIRKVLAQLKEAGLVRVARGIGGAQLAKQAEEINLLHIFQAVEPLGEGKQLFGFHDRPNPACSVGRQVHPLLDRHLLSAQQAMEASLAQTDLSTLLVQARQGSE